jgi:hypothetical protein
MESPLYDAGGCCGLVTFRPNILYRLSGSKGPSQNGENVRKVHSQQKLQPSAILQFDPRENPHGGGNGIEMHLQQDIGTS